MIEISAASERQLCRGVERGWRGRVKECNGVWERK